MESCSAEQLASLQSLTDSLGTPTLLRLSTLTTSDKGVKYVTCWLDNYTVVHGLFIYTDTKCGLFAFQDEFNNMEAIKIDPVNKNFEYVHEHLSATEFRSTLDDVANAGSGGGSSGGSGFIGTLTEDNLLFEFEEDTVESYNILLTTNNASANLSGRLVVIVAYPREEYLANYMTPCALGVLDYYNAETTTMKISTSLALFAGGETDASCANIVSLLYDDETTGGNGNVLHFGWIDKDGQSYYEGSWGNYDNNDWFHFKIYLLN